MAQLIAGLDAGRIRENLARVTENRQARDRSGQGAANRRGGAGRGARRDEVHRARGHALLHQAGIRLVGENRAQDLQAKVAAHGGLFVWDFIGRLQSRRVRMIMPHVRLIHSVASDSALEQLERHLELARPGLRILVEVNIAEEPGKAGVAPEELDGFIGRSPVPVAGLMTMPPLAEDPARNRPWFAALRELARERGLEHLSMGTSQDYLVAVEEGATIVRIGTTLYA